jgi:hypothetical protein
VWGSQSLRGIGVFVVLLAVAVGVVGYVVTRPPEQTLDAAGRAWVASFQPWRTKTEQRVEAAIVGIDFESEKSNARLLAPLRGCSSSLAERGLPPEFLESVHETAMEACGRAEHAVAVNEEFGFASLATTRLHLDEAVDRLRLAGDDLQVRLEDAEDDSS